MNTLDCIDLTNTNIFSSNINMSSLSGCNASDLLLLNSKIEGTLILDNLTLIQYNNKTYNVENLFSKLDLLDKIIREVLPEELLL